jgi:hypothetical protein
MLGISDGRKEPHLVCLARPELDSWTAGHVLGARAKLERSRLEAGFVTDLHLSYEKSPSLGGRLFSRALIAPSPKARGCMPSLSVTHFWDIGLKSSSSSGSPSPCCKLAIPRSCILPKIPPIYALISRHLITRQVKRSFGVAATRPPTSKRRLRSQNGPRYSTSAV